LAVFLLSFGACFTNSQFFKIISIIFLYYFWSVLFTGIIALFRRQKPCTMVKNATFIILWGWCFWVRFAVFYFFAIFALKSLHFFKRKNRARPQITGQLAIF